jgi:hypothetical protein
MARLEEWLRTAAEAAGAGDADPGLLGRDAVDAVLDLAREAAHGVARPAAPLATFAAGLAIGRGGGGAAELRRVVSQIASLAAVWPADEGDAPVA